MECSSFFVWWVANVTGMISSCGFKTYIFGGTGGGVALGISGFEKGPFLSSGFLTLTSSNRRNKLSHSPQSSGHFVHAMFFYGHAA